MQLTVDIDKTQILNLIDQLAINDKLQIVKKLEKDTLKYRIESLRDSISANGITEDDILSEVMSIRKK